MSKIKLIYYYIYSLFFCLRYLPFKQAIHVPILANPSIKIGELHKGSIVLLGKLFHSKVIFGLPGSESRANRRTTISVHNNGCLTFEGIATMAEGTTIIIDEGEMSIGNNFFCNSNCFFKCNKNINIGDNNLFGWDIELNTTDGHYFFENGERKNNTGSIILKNNVWVGSYSKISKNVIIEAGCVITQNSLIVKKHLVPNTLIGGIPAKDLKANISWSI